MKSKKGFTLIELLAVIVILAIIALIATPAIINVIENARKKAFENTSYGVLEGLKLDYTERLLDGTTSTPKEFTFPNSGLKLSGEQPAYGNAKIDGKGNISFVIVDKDKKWCAKKEADSEKVTVEDYSEENCKIDGTSSESNFGGTIVPVEGEETHKGIAYLDPTDLTKECNEGNAVSDTGTKTGCMKWYIYDDEGENYKMILDHNTTAKLAWNSSNINTEMKEVKVALETDTTGWTGSPRLITADEIAAITGNKSFNSATSTSNDWFYFQDNSQTNPSLNQGQSIYNWLFDRTEACTDYGCNIEDDSTRGYWTSTAVPSSSSNVWHVYNYGRMNSYYASDSDHYGVRPVITIAKSSVS